MGDADWTLVSAECPGGCNYIEVKHCYRYENEDLTYPAMVYTCNRKVMYFSFEYTCWHGSFVDVGYEMRLRFHYEGIEQKAKSAIVHRIAPGKYEGFDYAGRLIKMRFLRSYRFCSCCQNWR